MIVEPGAKIIGVTIAPGRYVPALTVVTNQADADRLPSITEQYQYKDLNNAVIWVNTQLTDPLSRPALLGRYQ